MQGTNAGIVGDCEECAAFEAVSVRVSSQAMRNHYRVGVSVLECGTGWHTVMSGQCARSERRHTNDDTKLCEQEEDLLTQKISAEPERLLNGCVLTMKNVSRQ